MRRWERSGGVIRCILGPAPKRRIDPVRYFNWLQFYDYSLGYPIGQAAHIADGVQWMMNSTYPLAVTCSSGKLNVEGGEIPETGSMSVEFPENYLLVLHAQLQSHALPRVQ